MWTGVRAAPSAHEAGVAGLGRAGPGRAEAGLGEAGAGSAADGDADAWMGGARGSVLLLSAAAAMADSVSWLSEERPPPTDTCERSSMWCCPG